MIDELDREGPQWASLDTTISDVADDMLLPSRTQDLLAAGASQPQALTEGFQSALLACALFVLAAAFIALRATNTRGEPVGGTGPEPVPEPEAA